MADIHAGDDVPGHGPAAAAAAAAGGSDPSGLPHWELLHLSAQAPGVKGALGQLATLDCAHLGLGAEGVEFLVRRLPHLPSPSASSASGNSGMGAGAASSTRDSTRDSTRSSARSSGGGGPAGAEGGVRLKLSLAHNALVDDAPTAKALGALLQRCPLAALDLGYNAIGPLCLLAVAAPLGKVRVDDNVGTPPLQVFTFAHIFFIKKEFIGFLAFFKGGAGLNSKALFLAFLPRRSGGCRRFTSTGTGPSLARPGYAWTPLV